MAKNVKAVRGPFQINGRKMFYVEVDRKRRSLGTDDPVKANKLVDALRAKYAEISEKPAEKSENSITFKAFQKQYLEWAEKIQPKKTFQANRLALQKIEPYCKDITLSDIGAFHLDQMVADNLSLGLKQSSVNCYIRHSKSALSQAVKWKLIPVHPFKDCRQLRISKRPPMAMDKDGIDALFNAIDDCYDHLLVRAYLITGRSRAELVRLDWSEIDWKNNRYYITRTKTHLSKWYPMGTAFRSVLEALGPDKSGPVLWRGYHPDTITHKIKDYMRLAGLEEHHFHHLRHSFCRLYLDTGGSIYALQQLLGHSQVQTTQVYSSLSPEMLADEIDKVNF